MEVQVVLGEVGEHGRRRSTTPVDPAEGQRVAADLHGDRVDAALAHDRQQRLQVGRLRRGAHARQHLAADPGHDRAEQAGAATGGPQPGLQQERGRGLAVGAGHAEHRHRLGRGGRAPAPRPRPSTARGSSATSTGTPSGPARVGARRVGEHGDRPGRDAPAAAKAAPWARAPGSAAYRSPGLHAPGVEGAAGHHDRRAGGRRGPVRQGPGTCGEEVAEGRSAAGATGARQAGCPGRRRGRGQQATRPAARLRARRSGTPRVGRRHPVLLSPKPMMSLNTGPATEPPK